MARDEVSKILEALRKKGVKTKDLHTLDFFAKDGSNLTQYYAHLVKSVTCWEINGRHKEALARNLPKNAKIVIGDSYELSKKTKDRFDMIVFDNPLALYGLSAKYCEHFDCLRLINDLLKSRGVVTFNVKLKPYDYELNYAWQKRRNNFYQVTDASNLDLDFVERHYVSLFKEMGYNVDSLFSVERKQEKSLYMIVAFLERNQN